MDVCMQTKNLCMYPYRYYKKKCMCVRSAGKDLPEGKCKVWFDQNMVDIINITVVLRIIQLPNANLVV